MPCFGFLVQLLSNCFLLNFTLSLIFLYCNMTVFSFSVSTSDNMTKIFSFLAFLSLAAAVPFAPDKSLNSQPVTVELYYESYCPGCRMFIQNQLYPAWKALKTSGKWSGDSFGTVKCFNFFKQRHSKICFVSVWKCPWNQTSGWVVEYYLPTWAARVHG